MTFVMICLGNWTAPFHSGDSLVKRPSLTPMSRALQLSNHPFRFLLYLEWGLLAVALMSLLDVPPPPVGRHGPPPGWEHSPLIAVVPLILFGLMGLYLPLGKLPRLGHTLGQILLTLITSATVFNDGRIIPAVYLVLVIRGCLMYGLAGRVMLAGAAFVLFVAGLQVRLRSLSAISRRLPPGAQNRLQGLIMGFQLNFIVLFGLSLLLVVLLINALLTERQSQQQLQQVNQELRRSAQEIEKLAMDQERSRIAREIHDALGHSLTALNIQLESALKLWDKDPSRAQQFLSEAKRLGSQSLQDVRQSVAALRQDPLAGRTLENAIAQLLKSLQTDSANSLTVTQDIQLSRPLPANFNLVLYRIVQEGLTNIIKHANARHIHLQLVSSAAVATLTLEDDGKGFNPDQARTGFGLQSMRDRAEATGGTFTISSPTAIGKGFQRGTRLQVSLPLPRAAQD
ncbi:sensor histidine kinase [Romeria aff. gracilis LEGE 07310]|uniref:histidine kinase n=1 Tax=Vasconcelosia minhoensis LEGE 07310 TaxID=915328 RepID=A0A8J7AJP3_9CYAN|nr:sensor histidine kinase [Romeria gracilis]MBE9080321.1 sensor histidine kinase [Romeria aff. gracilis LEGE 07310]